MSKKTLIKIITLILLVATMTLLFVGCESYGKKALTDVPLANATVTSNGGLTVMQGDYIYFINGKSGYSFTSSSQNFFNSSKNEKKGAIMRRKLVDGVPGDQIDVVVPKNVMTSYTKGGFYIFGEWIYYVSPVTKADFSGKMLSDTALDIMRTKTNGTGTQKLATVESNNFEYVATPTSVLYKTAENKIMRIDTTGKKPGKVTEIAADITGWIYFVNEELTQNSSKNYEALYVKATEDETSRANDVFVINSDGTTTKIITATTYTDKPEDAANVEKVFAIALKNAFIVNDKFIIYYEKSNYRGGTATLMGMYSYVLDGNTVNPEKEELLSPITRTGVIPETATSFYYMNTNILMKFDKATEEKDTKIVDFKATTTVKYITTDGGKKYIYYTKDTSLIRKDIAGGNAEVLMSNSNMASDWLGDEKIGNLWFYTNSADYTYTYYVNLLTYNPANDKDLKNSILGQMSVSDVKLKEDAEKDKEEV